MMSVSGVLSMSGREGLGPWKTKGMSGRGWPKRMGMWVWTSCHSGLRFREVVSFCCQISTRKALEGFSILDFGISIGDTPSPGIGAASEEDFEREDGERVEESINLRTRICSTRSLAKGFGSPG